MASVANMGRADDMSLLPVSHDTITQVHKFLHQFPALVIGTSYRLVFRSRRQWLTIPGAWCPHACGPVIRCARVVGLELRHAES
jgi:hypothetical protein